MSKAAVSDLHIESLLTRVNDTPHYLRTSPEYPMKRLLAAGFPDIYEIGPVFRDGESGQRHQPEFLMAEWYRLGFALDDIIDDTLNFLSILLGSGGSALQHNLNRGQRLRFDTALFDAIGIDSESSENDIARTVGPEIMRTLGPDKDALLDYLFDEHVARALPAATLTTITHYPASQAALADICDKTGKALRFEIYCGSLELANGFVELRNASTQRERFEADQRARAQRKKILRPLDEQFLDALHCGLPQCSGVAVGMDRLVMLAAGETDIRQVVSFAHRQGS